jgi:hypothetical protein
MKAKVNKSRKQSEKTYYDSHFRNFTSENLIKMFSSTVLNLNKALIKEKKADYIVNPEIYNLKF